MTKLLFALSLGFGIFIISAQSHANPNSCAARDKVITALDEEYGETRRSYGLARNNQVVELFVSDETGSWTILITSPNGNTCLMAAGDAFHATHPPLQPTGKPT